MMMHHVAGKSVAGKLTSSATAKFGDGGKNWDGYLWKHVATVDEIEAKRLKLFYTRAKKDFRIVKEGSVYAVFIRKG